MGETIFLNATEAELRGAIREEMARAVEEHICCMHRFNAKLLRLLDECLTAPPHVKERTAECIRGMGEKTEGMLRHALEGPQKLRSRFIPTKTALGQLN